MRSITMHPAPSNQPEVPRLFLHIGPPKTASTAFQRMMQGNSSGFLYGGTTQPRTDDGTELSSRLHYACSYPPTHHHTALPLAVQVPDEINRILQGGRSLVISEEMFLVDYVSTHQEKLGRLARILAAIPTTIILVVRDPVIGLSSLYQQLHAKLPIDQQLRFSRFLKTNQARIFDYGHLLATLQSIGFKDIRFVSFDDLVAGRLASTDVLGQHAGQPFRLAVRPGNVSSKAHDGRRRAFPPIRLNSIPMPQFLSRVRELTCGHWPRFQSFLSAAGRTTIYPGGMRTLRFPDTLASNLRASAEHVLGLHEPGIGSS